MKRPKVEGWMCGCMNAFIEYLKKTSSSGLRSSFQYVVWEGLGFGSTVSLLSSSIPNGACIMLTWTSAACQGLSWWPLVPCSVPCDHDVASTLSLCYVMEHRDPLVQEQDHGDCDIGRGIVKYLWPWCGWQCCESIWGMVSEAGRIGKGYCSCYFALS